MLEPQYVWMEPAEIVTTQLTMNLRFKGGRLQQKQIITKSRGLDAKSEEFWMDVPSAPEEPKCFTQPDPTFKNEVLNDVDA